LKSSKGCTAKNRGEIGLKWAWQEVEVKGTPEKMPPLRMPNTNRNLKTLHDKPRGWARALG